ncbi:hypothetical protein OPV22_023875 [Ensete ventricosum]|uniref:Uncharacterized protein n=1 Tax=Ensete ventricosum TaxID=4639 RepID=A0AAV8QXY6_ENSVE|nr:hypothetical protein OPV22_023875 [Ensete ventricosum]
MARMGEEDASIPPRAAHMGLRKSGVVSSHAIALKHYPNVRFRKEELSIGLLASRLAGPAEPANDHGLSLDIAVLNELRRKDAYQFCCCGLQVQGSGKRSSLLVPRT